MTPLVEVPRLELVETIARVLGRSVDSVDRLRGGRNSRVYSVTVGEGRRYLAKVYPPRGPEERDRLDAEYGALRFLVQHGVECVPKPVGLDRDAGCALYEFIAGDTIPSSTVTTSDVDQAVRFLVNLKSLTRKRESDGLPAAAEACFSVRKVVDNIELRLSRLLAAREEGKWYPAFHDFLAGDFVPAFRIIRASRYFLLESLGLSPDSELGREERTLSPSDFGFHNAIRRTDGRIVFLDFEYFGWDDPAKTASDFLLHPGMDLDERLKQRFWDGVMDGFRGYGHLARRTEIVYPLWGLKWCTILLNEFVPDLMDIREFAAGAPQDTDKAQERQLTKARRMLEKVMNEYRCFPYGD